MPMLESHSERCWTRGPYGEFFGCVACIDRFYAARATVSEGLEIMARGLSDRTRNAIMRSIPFSVYRGGDEWRVLAYLQDASDDEILSWRNVGPKTLTEIRTALAYLGRSFISPAPKSRDDWAEHAAMVSGAA